MAHEEHHGISYRAIFYILCFLTVITVAVAYVDFDGIVGFSNLNLVVAMLIASVKAGFVALFFMHLKHEDSVTWLYAFIPVFLLFLMIGGVFLDNPYRIDPRPEAVILADKKAMEEKRQEFIAAHHGGHGEDSGKHH